MPGTTPDTGGSGGSGEVPTPTQPLRHTAGGEAFVDNLKDFLAVGGEYKLTSDLRYEVHSEIPGQYAIHNRNSFAVYYQLIFIVNSGIGHVNIVSSYGVTAHVDENEFDNGRWRYVVSGVFEGITSEEKAHVLYLQYAFGDPVYEPRVQWTLRSATTRQTSPLPYPVPTFYDDGRLETPWLGRPLHERDIEESVAADRTVSTTGPPQPEAYVGPPEQEYNLFTSLGDQYYYCLYHELLNRYSARRSTKWALNLSPTGGGAFLYQPSTPNGSGWLNLDGDVPSWDAGSAHLIYFTRVSNLWAIGNKKGQYLAWSNQPSVGAYNSSLASFPLVFTSDLSIALKFEFSRADGYVGP